MCQCYFLGQEVLRLISLIVSLLGLFFGGVWVGERYGIRLQLQENDQSRKWEVFNFRGWVERGKEVFFFVGLLDWNQSFLCRIWDQLINFSGFLFFFVKWGWFDLFCKVGGVEQSVILCFRIYCICFYSIRFREVIIRDLLFFFVMIKDLS